MELIDGLREAHLSRFLEDDESGRTEQQVAILAGRARLNLELAGLAMQYETGEIIQIQRSQHVCAASVVLTIRTLQARCCAEAVSW